MNDKRPARVAAGTIALAADIAAILVFLRVFNII